MEQARRRHVTSVSRVSLFDLLSTESRHSSECTAHYKIISHSFSKGEPNWSKVSDIVLFRVEAVLVSVKVKCEDAVL